MDLSLLNERALGLMAAVRDTASVHPSVAAALEAYVAAGARPVALTSDPQALPGGANKTPPTEFRIWPYGTIDTTKGEFLFDKKAAASVMAVWTDYGNRLTFDYEHQAIKPDRRAGDGKASGSCLLELREDGLWAVDVRWTPRAAAEIAQGEWLYFSPYFVSDEKTGRILEIINLALTNVPATKNMQPLVAASRNTPSKDPTMATKNIKADGTAAAGDDEAMAKAKAAKLSSAKTRMAKALAELEAAKAECDALSEAAGGDEEEDVDTGKAPPPAAAPPGADDESAAKPAAAATSASKNVKGLSRVVAAAMEATGKDDPDEVIGALAALAQSKENETENTKRIVALESDLRAERSSKKIAKAMREGKLSPKMKEYALSIDNEKQLEAYLGSLSPIVTTSENGGTKKPDPAITIDAAKVSLSRIEEQLATELGVGADKMKEQKARNQSRRAAYEAASDDD